ncbi:MAG: lipopolysaccharide transport periplasmic protein LptA [Granulosicoccus sp.]|nr:lipopolysaccharide transport periplasmic protein LptA [Granulosicoccus sp.]
MNPDDPAKTAFPGRPILALALVICTCAAGLLQRPAQARESDLYQPIDVRADKSEFDEKAGTQTLIGNVEISQGSMRITADSISIALQDNALRSITGTGSPIHFEQQNEAGELMQGKARRIVYDALAGTLTLEGAASLSQPRQELVSERIIFNSRTQKVSAEGSPDGGRVSIQIQPPAGADSK